jgi:phosphatidylglycerol lysyltransferase
MNRRPSDDPEKPGLPPNSGDVLSGNHPERHPVVLWFLSNARWIWPIAIVTILIAASWSDLRTIQYRQVREALHGQAGAWVALAALLTLLNLGLMGLYDVICLRESHVPARSRWWIGSLAFAWSNFLTLGPLAGPAIRFWLYRPAGVTFILLRGAIVSMAAGFITGLGLWLIAAFMPVPVNGIPALSLRVVLVVLLAFFSGAIATRWSKWHRFPSWVHDLKVPWTKLFLLGAADWMLAGAVFAAVLHAGGMATPPDGTLRLFFAGQGIGLISLIPGGLGSADAFWLARMNTHVGREMAGLVTYRLLYYFLPWLAATIFLLRRAVHGGVKWAAAARTLVAILVVISGIVILISAATPGIAERMRLLRESLPMTLLESSHVATGIIGLLLLVLARGLMKGYRDAYRATIFLLLAGAAGSLLKGLDFEEAIILTLTAAFLWTHARLFSLPSRSGGTTVAILVPVVIAIAIFAAIGMTSYNPAGKPLPFWAHFSHVGFSARFVRTLSTMLLLGTLIAIVRVIRIPHGYVPPSGDEIGKALEIQRRVGNGTTALMVANGDKSIQFWKDAGFCLYRTTGSFLIVFSDPSIPPGTEREFLRSMLQSAAEFDRTLIFYQISAHWIPVLHDFGYSFFKLGEEAIVDLMTFNIQGNKGKFMRNVLNRFRNDGYEFSVLNPEAVRAVIPELRRISDEWLRSKNMREKRFSIGYFDSQYLSSFPCALVRDKSGKIVAFANLLQCEGGEELSVDLMRYLPECPNGVMDLLFLKLFEWGKERGFKLFNLGMAPLSTVGEAREARIGERLAKILFQYGEHWYNFRGLRLFKEKYNPRWVPRYLAYPAFSMLPRAIAHVSMVISGGWRNVVFPAASESGDGEQDPGMGAAGRVNA